MSTRWITAGMLLFVCAFGLVMAEESGEDKVDIPGTPVDIGKGYRLEVMGEKAEDLTFKFTPLHEPDQSTPEGVVRAYLKFATEEFGTAEERATVEIRINKAISASMSEAETALFTEERLTELTERRSRSRHTSTHADDTFRFEEELPHIDEITIEDGVARVIVHSVTRWYRRESVTDEWDQPRVNQSQRRYVCVRGDDDKWRISAVEDRTRDWAGGSDSWQWKDTGPILAMYYWLMGEHDLPEVEGYRQDTPQNAALALYRYLIPTNERLQLQTVQRAYTGLVEILEGLVTEDVIKQSKEPDEDLVDFLYKMHDLEVESVTEGADGARHVKFKPVSEWASAFEVRVRKVGDVWKIYEAGRHRPKWSDSGDTTYEYEKLDNIYYSLLDS